jgi:2-oxoglutarate dehydrogenase E2 component (dihydrolipoamide succinyltransferase)
MKVEMVMPQMGESIAEGTIVKWRKGVGDMVTMDEDILEISTDKVDSEIPSPATGRIVEIVVPEGKTVPIKALLAIIETEAGAAVAGSGAPLAKAVAAEAEEVADRPPAQMSSPHDGSADGGIVVKEFKRHSETPPPPPPASEGGKGFSASERGKGFSASEGGKEAPTEKTSNFLSPLVQRIMAEEGVSLDEVNRMVGSGEGGRVTKKDVLEYVARRKFEPEPRALPFPLKPPEAKILARQAATKPAAQTAITPPSATSGAKAVAPSGTGVASTSAPTPSGSIWVGQGDTVVEMDRMRKAIADHMVRSVHTSPHVVSFAEVDMSRIVRHREGIKDSFKAQEGVNITYTSYFIYCAAKALKEFPYVNASVDGYNVILRKAINIGFAVELPSGGLIVPVIRGVDALNLTGVARGLSELADKARANRLDPNDVSGGTFTVTNVGVFGNVAGAPIINQPQVAILGTGAIKKHPVVVETKDGDFIAIKPMMMMSLSYDHRIIDGALAGRFMARLGQLLENFEG